MIEFHPEPKGHMERQLVFTLNFLQKTGRSSKSAVQPLWVDKGRPFRCALSKITNPTNVVYED